MPGIMMSSRIRSGSQLLRLRDAVLAVGRGLDAEAGCLEHHLGGDDDQLLVFDDQDGSLHDGTHCDWVTVGRRSSCRCTRQREGEIGTLAQLAGDFDATSVRFDDATGDEQAEAGAAVVAGQRVLDLEELLEDPAVVARIDADAVVPDAGTAPGSPSALDDDLDHCHRRGRT
jgi:hypothetical protein